MYGLLARIAAVSHASIPGELSSSLRYASAVVLYREEQSFGWSPLAWLILALQIIPLIMVVIGLQTDDAEALFGGVAAFVIIGLTQLWIMTARLVTIVDRDALRISFKWLWPGRTIKHSDIERYEARTYGLLDSGGWGVHLAGAGWSYNVSGNRGVAVVLKNGARLLVGSQQPESLVRALDDARSSRTGA
jgi:hypothetical protein